MSSTRRGFIGKLGALGAVLGVGAKVVPEAAAAAAAPALPLPIPTVSPALDKYVYRFLLEEPQPQNVSYWMPEAEGGAFPICKQPMTQMEVCVNNTETIQVWYGKSVPPGHALDPLHFQYQFGRTAKEVLQELDAELHNFHLTYSS
jgi:hypothetical protein